MRSSLELRHSDHDLQGSPLEEGTYELSLQMAGVEMKGIVCRGHGVSQGRELRAAGTSRGSSCEVSQGKVPYGEAGRGPTPGEANEPSFHG